MKRYSLCVMLAVLLACAAAPAARADFIVFSTDFQSGVPAQLSGITTLQGVQLYNGLGPTGNQFSGQFLRNDTGGNPTGTPGLLTRLTLTGLPSHPALDVNFLFAVIDSWDGFNGNPGPDLFNVRVDSVRVFTRSFAQASRSSDYTPAPGVLLASGSDRGFGAGTFFSNDGAYNMYREPAFHNLPHTANMLSIDWFANGASWQGNLGNPAFFDESWAIDNVQVVVRGGDASAIPEPASLSGFGYGALAWWGYGAWNKRRRLRANLRGRK